MSYPTEAEQEAFTAGWNAAMEHVEKQLHLTRVGVMETMAELAEPAIETWIEDREKAPGRV